MATHLSQSARKAGEGNQTKIEQENKCITGKTRAEIIASLRTRNAEIKQNTVFILRQKLNTFYTLRGHFAHGGIDVFS